MDSNPLYVSITCRCPSITPRLVLTMQPPAWSHIPQLYYLLVGSHDCALEFLLHDVQDLCLLLPLLDYLNQLVLPLFL